jgi:hypothetical protein
MKAKWPVWTFAVGVLAAMGALAFAILRYPGVVDDPQALVYLAALVAIVGAYLAVAVVALVRPTSPALATGVWFGGVAGLAGLWTGLISGTIMATAMVGVQLSNLGLLGARADYQAELARSSYTDMATYLASDAVAAALMHMVLNVVLGMVGGGLGALIALLVRPRATRATA